MQTSGITHRSLGLEWLYRLTKWLETEDSSRDYWRGTTAFTDFWDANLRSQEISMVPFSPGARFRGCLVFWDLSSVLATPFGPTHPSHTVHGR